MTASKNIESERTQDRDSASNQLRRSLISKKLPNIAGAVNAAGAGSCAEADIPFDWSVARGRSESRNRSDEARQFDVAIKRDEAIMTAGDFGLLEDGRMSFFLG